MKILLVADGRSPITRAWIRGMAGLSHQVDLISSYPCEKPDGIERCAVLPLAFSGVGRKPASGGGKSSGGWMRRFRLVLLGLRYYLGPLSILAAAGRYRKLVEEFQPDLVHALRIPYEGMLASYTPVGVPLAISSWGNDFILHARGSFLMKAMTRRAVQRADGFTADCQRDIRLACEWGLRSDAPAIFAPGNGGLDLARIEQIKADYENAPSRAVDDLMMINPRGIRPAYVRNDVFFHALPLVLREIPGLKIVCSAMRGEPDAEKWVKELGLEGSVTLLDSEPQEKLWRRYMECSLLVSPAIFDGTPNSVLEGMALGCLPVVGDIESLREWITNGENGLLADPNDPAALAAAIVRGLRDVDLRRQAKLINRDLVLQRADVRTVMPRVDAFYRAVAAGK